MLLNIGGIANLTYIPAGATLDQVIAFDTGPGNCISDHLIRLHAATPEGLDPSGRIAARGTPSKSLIQQILSDPWFRLAPPKSTDGPAMIRLFEIAAGRSDRTRLSDFLASACRFTALAASEALVRFIPNPVDEIIASGGGVIVRMWTVKGGRMV